MGLRGLVSKLGTLRRACARVCACMHVESVVVHVCMCVRLWTVFEMLNAGKKRISLALYGC